MTTLIATAITAFLAGYVLAHFTGNKRVNERLAEITAELEKAQANDNRDPLTGRYVGRRK